MSERGIRWATLGLLVLLATFCILRIEPTSSITHFLPSEEAAEGVALARRLVESDLSRAMVLRVDGEGDRAGAARALAAALRTHPEVAWVSGQGAAEEAEAMVRVLFPRRLYLASDAPEAEIPALLEPDALRERAAALRERLAGPTAPLLTRQAPADPLDLLGRILERARAARPAAATDGTHVFLRTRASAFDSARQAPFLDDLERTFARVAAGHGDLVLRQSGVNRIAVASERSIRRDVDFISLVSWLGVGALFLVFFRSLRCLGLVLLPPALGIATAGAVASVLFVPVHGATLGFGLALVGVAIDYPVHLLVHHALGAPGTPPARSLRAVRRSLLVGGGTTALCFGVLSLSGFPGVGDMGAFAVIGIAAALATTLLALPAFLPGDGSTLATPALRAAAGWAGRFAVASVAWRGTAALVLLAYLAIAAAGLPRVRWNDDPGALSTADTALAREDRLVRAQAGGVETDRFVVVRGASEEEALRRNDRVHAALEGAVRDGHLAGMRSVHAVLFSQALQRRNLDALRSVPDLASRIDTAFAAEGFRAGAFAPFARDVATPPAPPLRAADLAGTPLAPLVDAGLVRLGDDTAAVTTLRGVRSPEGIRAALAGIEGARYVDHGEVLHEVFAGYRRTMLRLLAVGAAGVGIALFVRYRRPWRALLAFVPCALVALATLGVLGLLGVPANLLSVVSLLLVMGLGVDYGVFVLDGVREPTRLPAILLALAVSCLTTVFVFGTLALSEHPALRSIGLTTGIGLALAFMAAPAVLVLASPRRDGQRAVEGRPA